MSNEPRTGGVKTRDALQTFELFRKDLGVGTDKAELVVEFVHDEFEEGPVEAHESYQVSGRKVAGDVRPDFEWKLY